MPLMSQEAWRRHANPWSVYTRFAAIPAGVAAGWSRQWIGAGWLILFALVVLWLVLNTVVFPPVTSPRSWISKGIFGEHLWLAGTPMPTGLRRANRLLVVAGAAGLLATVAGVVVLSAPLTVAAVVFLVAAQLWRIRLFSRFYDDHVRGAPAGA